MENNGDIRYRIMTEDEMVANNGTLWRHTTSFNVSGLMDYLLGRHIDVPDKYLDDRGAIIASVVLPNENPLDSRSSWYVGKNYIICYSTDIKYRIKTEQEFLEEFGEEWRTKVYFNTNGYMDYLLGSDITVDIRNTDYDGNIIKNINIPNRNPSIDVLYWVITPNMMRNIPIANYSPRKTVY